MRDFIEGFKDGFVGFFKRFKKLRPYKPYLDLWINLGFFGVRTELMHYALDRDAYTYIGLEWHFFKWNGKFKLYKPGREY